MGGAALDEGRGPPLKLSEHLGALWLPPKTPAGTPVSSTRPESEPYSAVKGSVDRCRIGFPSSPRRVGDEGQLVEVGGGDVDEPAEVGVLDGDGVEVAGAGGGPRPRSRGRGPVRRGRHDRGLPSLCR
ncbi:hypothetical protein GCM10010272_40330 [Streptomyces lateritius]|nr:hypothetical protein GCM10010272_40330 [Streptomyces lateritius]